MTESATIESSSLGEGLRQRRQERGLSLEAVATQTRIRVDYLEALENGHYEALPSTTHVTGFLRAYATVLQLDGDLLVAAYRQQVAPPATTAPVSVPSHAGSRRRWLGIAAGIFGVLVLLLVLAAAVLWLFRPPVPEPEAESALVTEGFAVPPAAAPVADVAPPVIAPPSAPATGGEGAEDTLMSPAAELPPRRPAVAATPSPAPVPAPLPPIAPGGSALKLEALVAGDMEVAIDDHPRRSYPLAVGTVLGWKVARSVRIQIAQPAQVRLWLDGEELDLAGRSELELTARDASAEP